MRFFSGMVCEQVWLSAAASPWRENISLRLGLVLGRNPTRFAVAQPVTFKEEVDPDLGVEVPPFMSLHTEEAQTLMDELWRAGIRPSKKAGPETEAAALERHLADMRKLAFHALKVPNEN
jgi:hypothetical protein